MSCGSMGKRKTTLITDMALSQEVMFRQEALKRLQIADMKFPYFPWILFEDEIKICMQYRVIYNLATIKIWIEKKRKRYEKHKNSELQLYGYILKYIEKSGERIVYSRGLPQYFISDILPEDVVMKVGQEEKKLLLFDDFKCIDEGCIIGTVSEDTIKQMPKSN